MADLLSKPSYQKALRELQNVLRALVKPSSASDSSFENPYDMTKSKVEAEKFREHVHGKLYEGKFSDVALHWREAYEDACIWVALHCVNDQVIRDGDGEHRDLTWVDEMVKAIDMGIIMVGAPQCRHEILHEVFPLLERILSQASRTELTASVRKRKAKDDESTAKRQCCRLSTDRQEGDLKSAKSHTVFSSAQISHPPLANPLPRLASPSLATFQQRLAEDHRKSGHQGALPLVITHAIDHWPACQPNKWSSPAYLLDRTLGGRRLVPIEIGRSYTDESWGQQIVSFRRFLREFAELDDVDGGADEDPLGEAGQTVYLAQYDLLSQVPSLRNDICVPDYCYSEPPIPARHGSSSSTNPSPVSSASDDQSEPTINAWLGPANTISPLHTDPHHNILAQVVGRKYVRLYAPKHTTNLYPRDTEQVGDRAVDMSNTSRIDLDVAMKACEGKEFGRDECEIDDSEGEDYDAVNADSMKTDERSQREAFLREFPLFAQAEYVEAILEPGDCLFVPRGWWHYVRSLSASFSVSFWWD